MGGAVILAIDPGTTRHGWALVSPARGSSVRYIASGHDDESEIVARIIGGITGNACGTPPQLVCIERPAFISAKAMAGQALLDTARWAGVFEGRAVERGIVAMSMTAAAWRLALCGSNHPDDATVKRAVSMLVQGMPARSNCHERDALGLGIVASWTCGRRAA